MSLTSDQKFDVLDAKLDMIGFDVTSGKLPATLGQGIYEGKCVVQIGGTEPANTNFEMFIDRDGSFGIAIDEVGNPDGRVEEVLHGKKILTRHYPACLRNTATRQGTRFDDYRSKVPKRTAYFPNLLAHLPTLWYTSAPPPP